MAPVCLQQVIHGYRDGHRLLGCSTRLGTDSTRAMLMLSDMSGPSMRSGFEEYLTGYPLPGAEFYVLAKTWYAPEMERPGCVWTHSLLVPLADVSHVTNARLLAQFRRPQMDEPWTATPKEVLVERASEPSANASVDRSVATALVSAVLGQPRPVVVGVDGAMQLEAAMLQLWEGLWLSAKGHFSFCTGALAPRLIAGELLDLQAIPNAIWPSALRKAADDAFAMDLGAVGKPEPWVDLVLDATARRGTEYHRWFEAVAGPDAGRTIVAPLAQVFDEWHAPDASVHSILACVLTADLPPRVRHRLISMTLERAETESGTTRRWELIEHLCRHRDNDLDAVAPLIVAETQRLFADSRGEGMALVFALLRGELTEVGERVLRAALVLVSPKDLETIKEEQRPFLSTIVGANPELASTPVLWTLAGSQSSEVLSQLGDLDLTDEKRRAVVEAILSQGCDAPVDALVRFGGKAAVFCGLAALASGMLQSSFEWRSVLLAHPDTVLEWLESLPTPTLRELELGSRFASPKPSRPGLVDVWTTGIAGATTIPPRVAAFGLALALSAGDVNSPLFARCFQPTYDAAASSRLQHDEWEWLRRQAPALSWYRDWDRCERLAAALARRLEKSNAPLETLFSVVHSRLAIRKVAAILGDEKRTRKYLKYLRKAAKSSSAGSRDQRDALLDKK